MKTIFFGSREFVTPVINALAKHTSLLVVITKPDAPAGRGKKLTPSPIKSHTQQYYPNLPILTPEKLDDELYRKLSELKADLFVVAAYGLLIPQRFLDLPKLMTLNVHPSLLPKLRGASPLQSAILDGSEKTGVSIIKLDERLDHGPLLWQQELVIEREDTFLSLGEKAFLLTAQALPQIINSLELKTFKLTPQDDSQATFCTQIKREDGYIDITNPPDKEIIKRMLRAYYRWPGVWTKLQLKKQETRIKLFSKEIVQIEGKKPMQLKDFINGYPELKEEITKLL